MLKWMESLTLPAYLATPCKILYLPKKRRFLFDCLCNQITIALSDFCFQNWLSAIRGKNKMFNWMVILETNMCRHKQANGATYEYYFGSQI